MGDYERSRLTGCPPVEAALDRRDDLIATLRSRLALLEAVIEALPRCDWYPEGTSKQCGKVATHVCATPDPSEPNAPTACYCEECAVEARDACWKSNPLPYRPALLALKTKGTGNG